MTNANLNGWEFVLSEDVEVIWDGISDTNPDHVTIVKGLGAVDNKTANSTISFNLHGFLETDENHYCFLMGPPNHFIDGAKPMAALIRSDWYQHTSLQYCWKLTTPNKVVKFPAGSPFMFLFNYPKNLLENTTFSIKRATEDHTRKMDEYGKQRDEFDRSGFKFPNLYKKQLDFKPSPQKPIVEP